MSLPDPTLHEQIRSFAFGLPEAWEDHPWGESVAKVGKKVFVFMGMGQGEDGSAHLTVKLPDSHEEALALPFAETPGYGLDRGHWVTLHAPPDAPAGDADRLDRGELSGSGPAQPGQGDGRPMRHPVLVNFEGSEHTAEPIRRVPRPACVTRTGPTDRSTSWEVSVRCDAC